MAAIATERTKNSFWNWGRSSLHIDFHAHVLPGADHGSADLKTSLEQLRLAQEAGIDTLIATPHFYPAHDRIDEFLTRRLDCFAELRANMPEQMPQLLLGAEVQLCIGLENLPELEELCVHGTRVLLLELPPVFQPSAYQETLDALVYQRRLEVVLAHIDRYDHTVIDPLLESGLKAQLNASSFCRLRTRRRSLRYAALDCVVALGSDIHGTQIGYREFLEAKKRLGAEYTPLMQRTQGLLGLGAAARADF